MWFDIRIMAEEANQKGDLFGRLMSDLFLSLGYDNVRLNIARSGREIDIEAEHRLESRHAIAECKALITKVGGTEINTFAGKLRTERRRRGRSSVAAYFISLLGFTETAIDQESEAIEDAVILIDGRRVIAELIKGKILASPSSVAAQACQLAARCADDLTIDERYELLAHDKGWIWAVYFTQGKQRTHIALIHADGTALSADIAGDIIADDAAIGGKFSTVVCLNRDYAQGVDKLRLTQALATYHQYLSAECGYILLDGLPADADVGALRLRLEHLFVPLHVLLDLGNNLMASASRVRRRKSKPGESFGTILSKTNRVAVLASPGGGKSTLVKRLAIAYGNPERRPLSDDRLPERNWLPLFFRCRELRADARSPFLNLIDTLSSRALIGENAAAFVARIQAALRSGDVLLLVDGLDEISDVGDRSAFVRNLRTFLAIYPSVSLVVTSRKAGFRYVAGLIASQCLQVEIADFTASDIRRLTESWHREVLGDRPDVIAEARRLADTISTNDRISRLAVNPLLLTTLLLVKRWVGQLPTRRSVLYGKAVEVLLMTWNVEGHEPIEQDEALPQLCYTSFAMMSNGVQKISRSDLGKLLTSAREELAAELSFARIKVQEFIERIETRSSLLMMTGHEVVDGTLVESYEFRHLTFQEYLTAKAVVEGWYPDRKEEDSIESILAVHFRDEKWREVIPLSAVLAGRKAEPLIKASSTFEMDIGLF
jgi:hypothetical protein